MKHLKIGTMVLLMDHMSFIQPKKAQSIVLANVKALGVDYVVVGPSANNSAKPGVYKRDRVTDDLTYQKPVVVVDQKLQPIPEYEITGVEAVLDDFREGEFVIC